jgi:hypothetical protein
MPTPTPQPLVVSNLSVATGLSYVLGGPFTDCCSNGHGPDWVDFPYVLQRNLGGSAAAPFYIIQTSIADTSAGNNPLVSFDISKRCGLVTVIFADKGPGPDTCGGPTYPSWILSGGFNCSVTCGGTVETFFHNTLGASDQIGGPSCSKSFNPGSTVKLGPREANYANAEMYTVVVTQDTTTPGCP